MKLETPISYAWRVWNFQAKCSCKASNSSSFPSMSIPCFDSFSGYTLSQFILDCKFWYMKKYHPEIYAESSYFSYRTCSRRYRQDRHKIFCRPKRITFLVPFLSRKRTVGVRVRLYSKLCIPKCRFEPAWGIRIWLFVGLVYISFVFPKQHKYAKPSFAWQQSYNSTKKRKQEATPPPNFFPTMAGVLVGVVFIVAVWRDAASH